MSDSYITISTKKEIQNSPQVGDTVIHWLKSKRYIDDELTDCILSTKSKGYRPGLKHVDVIGFDENIQKWKVCGVEIKTSREVFNAGAFTAMTRMECPNCNRNRFEGITAQDFFMDKCTDEQVKLFYSVHQEFKNWTNGQKATLVCPHCSENINLESYSLDNTIALSNFGLTFWNWPDLTKDFLNSLQVVIGAEIIRINGHL